MNCFSSKTNRLLFTMLLTLGVFTGMQSQTSVGVDIYSRYIFRGSDYGDALSFQPSLSYAVGDLSIGIWGAYSDAGKYSEADIWASYSFGPITTIITDYYIPSAPPTIPFFNYSPKGSGAHIVEIGIGYVGQESMPLSVTGFVNVFGDTLKSMYVQASYVVLENLSLTLGLTPKKGIYTLSSSLNANSSAGLVSVGFIGSKTIKVTEDFSIPFNVQYIMNPYAESAYLIFGLGL